MTTELTRLAVEIVATRQLMDAAAHTGDVAQEAVLLVQLEALYRDVDRELDRVKVTA